ncbi:unnamed protein product, partial [Prorocentrum cordatum]
RNQSQGMSPKSWESKQRRPQRQGLGHDAAWLDHPPRREALEFAAVQLRACPEIVLAAVRRSPGALRFAAPELRGDPAVVLAAAERGWFSPGWASLLSAPGLCGDRAVALAAVAQDRRRRRRQSCA